MVSNTGDTLLNNITITDSLSGYHIARLASSSTYSSLGSASDTLVVGESSILTATFSRS